MYLSCCMGAAISRFGIEKAFEMYHEAGFTAVDYPLGGWVNSIEKIESNRCYQSDEEIIEHFSKVKEIADHYQIKIGQTHALFGTFQAVDTEEYRKCVRGSILATATLGCPYIVIHPIAIPGRLFDEKVEESFEYNYQFFNELKPLLKKYNIKNAIEPMWGCDQEHNIRPTVCSRPENIIRLIEALGSESFCACLDFGHINLTGNDTNDTVAGAIRKLGSYMEVVHIHETKHNQDTHTAPFMIPKEWNWPEILQAMKDVHFNKSLSFEVEGENYFNLYPDELFPEALRHLATIGKQFIQTIEQ